MKTFKWILIGLGIFLLLFLAVGSWYLYQMDRFFEEIGDCTLDAGPYYGEVISENIDIQEVEVYIPYEGGRFAFLHISDTLAPLMMKLDSVDQQLWALKLSTDDDVDLLKMEDIRLENHVIRFFNSSMYEPGSIYLNERYEFKFMCLSLF